ncbi:26S proteasome regulatory subunit 4-like [Myotis daubentonii]|uniref:26S proteasome regulatory subunit 4-like n=1 Tax=Myotis daubentonii TaxID=98922 RepID=UPI0028731695|nr:26S proteasome regulatory subunit 4-like [Myotis daubentonii]
MKPLREKQEEERSKVDDLRGTPMSVRTLEEIFDDNHAIVSTSVGSEHYVCILSLVDKDLLGPGCSVLLNHKVHDVIGVLMDDTDPLVTVVKVEKASQETSANTVGEDGVPPPDEKTKEFIFQVHTSRRTLADDGTLDDLVTAKGDLAGADIKAICTGAGLRA